MERLTAVLVAKSFKLVWNFEEIYVRKMCVKVTFLFPSCPYIAVMCLYHSPFS